jgi:P27 family predicted phage terminase small subunit
MKGRKRKPLKQQAAAGDPRKLGKGKLQQQLDAEPIAARGLPACPEHLEGRARAAWEFWRVELEAMQLDCRPDAQMLEGACSNYARAVQADLILAKDGPVVDEVVLYKGEILIGVVRKKKHPAVAVSNAAWALVKGFCSEFGLSPVSRTRLAIERKDDGERNLHDLLSGPRLTPEEKGRIH